MRPRHATGVPFRGGQPEERGQPGVGGDAPEGYGPLPSRAIDNGYPESPPRDYEQPITTALHSRRPPVGPGRSRAPTRDHDAPNSTRARRDDYVVVSGPSRSRSSPATAR